MARVLSVVILLSRVILVAVTASPAITAAIEARDAIADRPDFIGYIFISADPAYCKLRFNLVLGS